MWGKASYSAARGLRGSAGPGDHSGQPKSSCCSPGQAPLHLHIISSASCPRPGTSCRRGGRGLAPGRRGEPGDADKTRHCKKDGMRPWTAMGASSPGSGRLLQTSPDNTLHSQTEGFQGEGSVTGSCRRQQNIYSSSLPRPPTSQEDVPQGTGSCPGQAVWRSRHPGGSL